MPLQRADQARWQHGNPVLVALAAADYELAARKVHVFHAQRQCLRQTQASTVKYSDDQARMPLELGIDALDFLLRQHHRQALRTPRPYDRIQQWQLDPEHMPVQEQQGLQRLILRRSRDLSLRCQPGQEGSDFRGSQLARMPTAVKADEPPDPAKIGLLGPNAVMPDAKMLSHHIE